MICFFKLYQWCFVLNVKKLRPNLGNIYLQQTYSEHYSRPLPTLVSGSVRLPLCLISTSYIDIESFRPLHVYIQGACTSGRICSGLIRRCFQPPVYRLYTIWLYCYTTVCVNTFILSFLDRTNPEHTKSF